MKILIIDDNKDDREFLKRSLHKSNDSSIEVFEIYSEEKLYSSLLENPPSCILLDYSLPGRNGIEVLKKIRAKYPFLPIIMLTGQGNEQIAVNAIKEGAQDYLVKSSITSEHLFHIIKVAIEHCHMKEKVKEQKETLEIFARALAHDLRSPLNTIISFSTLIQSKPELIDKYISVVTKTANNMDKIIKSVKQYTELDDNKDDNLKECNLNNILMEALTNLDELIKNQNAVINYDELPNVIGNENQLLQVFQNLIQNAINHSISTDITVSIKAKITTKFIKIIFKDNNPSINSNYKEEIFSPLKRFDSQDSHEGSGLGLSICQKIMKQHNGKISLVNKIDDESSNSFCLTFPRLKKELIKPTKSDLHLANILFVDDSHDELFLSKMALQDVGKVKFNYYSANNGLEALNFLRNPKNPKINLIILDINMPIMDGFQFLRILNEKPVYPVTVILNSSSDFVDDKIKADKLQTFDYLIKPLTKEKFLNSIGKAPNISLEENENTIKIYSGN